MRHSSQGGFRLGLLLRRGPAQPARGGRARGRSASRPHQGQGPSHPRDPHQGAVAVPEGREHPASQVSGGPADLPGHLRGTGPGSGGATNQPDPAVGGGGQKVDLGSGSEGAERAQDSRDLRGADRPDDIPQRGGQVANLGGIEPQHPGRQSGVEPDTDGLADVGAGGDAHGGGAGQVDVVAAQDDVDAAVGGNDRGRRAPRPPHRAPAPQGTFRVHDPHPPAIRLDGLCAERFRWPCCWFAGPDVGLLGLFTFACAVTPANINKASK